eukprot:jgi/Ulvmu1/2159/UM013_0002.1
MDVQLGGECNKTMEKEVLAALRSAHKFDCTRLVMMSEPAANCPEEQDQVDWLPAPALPHSAPDPDSSPPDSGDNQPCWDNQPCFADTEQQQEDKVEAAIAAGQLVV